MTVIPLGNKILVELFPEPTAYTASKLLIVDTQSAAMRWGKVLETGPDAFRVEVDQEVLVNTLHGREIGIKNQILVPDTAVLLTRDVDHA